MRENNMEILHQNNNFLMHENNKIRLRKGAGGDVVVV
jgi:hypothetical protein